MYLYYFEKLDVYQRSFELINQIYKLTKDLPRDENFGLTSQIRRASISVMANIVEGNSRNTRKDQANFTSISYSSLMELLSLLMVAESQSYISRNELEGLRKSVDIIAIELNALRKKQLSTI